MGIVYRGIVWAVLMVLDQRLIKDCFYLANNLLINPIL